MAIQVLLALFTICALIVYMYINRRKEAEPPSLSGKLPVIGHSYIFFTGKSGRGWSRLWSRTADECWNKGGVISVNFVFPHLTHYIIGDPDDSLVVANNSTKHYFYKSFRKQLGDGLLVSKGEKWKYDRKQMNPAFSSRFHKTLMVIFNACGRALCETWASEIGAPFEHMQSISEAAITAVLGDVTKECDVSIKDYVDAVSFIDRTISLRLGRIPLHLDFIFYLTKDGRAHMKMSEYIYREAEKIINATRKRMQKCRDNNSKNTPEIKTIIDYLVQYAEFDEQALLDQVTTVLVGGHITTASSLTSLFVLLGSYPEVQDKLYEELTAVYGTSDRDLVKEDFARLPYLEAVVMESMRLYPAAPTVFRHSDKKMILKNYTIPANRCYIINVYASNRHPVWGEDRMRFRPERWLEPDQLPPLHAFASFSLGRRSCIGRSYAILSMKAIVAHVVRRYRVFADVSNYKVKLEYITKPSEGGVIRIERRESDNTPKQEDCRY